MKTLLWIIIACLIAIIILQSPQAQYHIKQYCILREMREYNEMMKKRTEQLNAFNKKLKEEMERLGIE